MEAPFEVAPPPDDDCFLSQLSSQPPSQVWRGASQPIVSRTHCLAQEPQMLPVEQGRWHHQQPQRPLPQVHQTQGYQTTRNHRQSHHMKVHQMHCYQAQDNYQAQEHHMQGHQTQSQQAQIQQPQDYQRHVPGALVLDGQGHQLQGHKVHDHQIQAHQKQDHKASAHSMQGSPAPAPPLSSAGGEGPSEAKQNALDGLLRPVSDIPIPYRSLFTQFPFFNIVQSTVFQDVFGSNRSVVVSAPTGSGKTVLMELALVRLLMDHSDKLPQNQSPQPARIVYMAPMKALVTERYLDWRERLAPLGLSCAEVTGDTEHDDITVIRSSQVILTTPEKWDFLTRRWRDHASLMQAVSLLLIDEVHVLSDEGRGPTLEAVVSRMKTIRATRPSNGTQTTTSLRFVAVSATIPNVEDVAAWLSDDCAAPAISHKLEESLRPVKLRRVVLGYSCRETWTEFRFDISLNYRLPSVIATYSDNKPTLVFVSTRKAAQSSAVTLTKEARLIRDAAHKQLLTTVANGLRDSKLRECVMCGVGFHHAGLVQGDRRQVEELFIASQLPVLVATSTLATGVNLPAHLVVVKSTSQYVGGAYEEYSSAQLLQMTGRAGRPQYDTHATAVIMTKAKHKVKYENLVTGRSMLESYLHLHLAEHLNAEIVLGTVTDLGVAVEWLRSTFLYVRVQHNPRHYGLPPNLQHGQLEAKLQELCTREVNALAHAEVILLSEVDIKPTLPGRLMARYCISFSTMKTFLQLKGDESLQDLVEMVSGCREFYDIKVRVAEKRVLNEMNKSQTSSIRFPIKGKIKTREHKVNCLIQATLGNDNIVDASLSQEAGKVIRTGQRLTKCLAEYGWSRAQYRLALNTSLLAKCFSCRLWEDSRYVTRQLERIGPTLSAAFVHAKITSFAALEATSPRDIELILNRQPPFGNRIRDHALKLPRYEVTVEQLNQVSRERSDLRVTVRLANQEAVREASTTPPHHACRLLLGDADNKLVHHQRVTDAALKVCGSVSRVVNVSRAQEGDALAVDLISETWGGLDVQSHYTPRYLPRPISTLKPAPAAGPTATPDHRNAARDVSGDGERRACLHTCGNKSNCAHTCCKVGVSARGGGGRAAVPSVVQEVRRRTTQLPENPVKKLKTGTSSGVVDVSQFRYTPSRSLLMPAPRTAPQAFPSVHKLCHFNGEQPTTHPVGNSSSSSLVKPQTGRVGYQGHQTEDVINDDVLFDLENDVDFQGHHQAEDMISDDILLEFENDFGLENDNGDFQDMDAFLVEFEKENLPRDYENAFNDPLEIEDTQTFAEDPLHPVMTQQRQKLVPSKVESNSLPWPSVGVRPVPGGRGTLRPSQPPASQNQRALRPLGLQTSQGRGLVRPPTVQINQSNRGPLRPPGAQISQNYRPLSAPSIQASHSQRPIRPGAQIGLDNQPVRPPVVLTNQNLLLRPPGVQTNQYQLTLRPPGLQTNQNNQSLGPTGVQTSQNQRPLRPPGMQMNQAQRPSWCTGPETSQRFGLAASTAGTLVPRPAPHPGGQACYHAGLSSQPQVIGQRQATSHFSQGLIRLSQAPGTVQSTEIQRLSLMSQAQRPSLMSQTQRPSQMSQTQRPSQMSQTQRPLLQSQTQRPSLQSQTQRPLLMSQTQRPLLLPQTQRPSMQSETQRPSVMSQTQKPSLQLQTQRPLESVNQTPALSRQVPETSYRALRPGHEQAGQSRGTAGHTEWQNTQIGYPLLTPVTVEEASRWMEGVGEASQVMETKRERSSMTQHGQAVSTGPHTALTSRICAPPVKSADTLRSQTEHPEAPWHQHLQSDAELRCLKPTESDSRFSGMSGGSDSLTQFCQRVRGVEGALLSQAQSLSGPNTDKDTIFTPNDSTYQDRPVPVGNGHNYQGDAVLQEPHSEHSHSSQHSVSGPHSRPVAGVRPMASSSAGTCKKTQDFFSHLTKEWDEVQRGRCRGKLSNVYLPTPSPRLRGAEDGTPSLAATLGRRDDDWRDLEMFQWFRQQEKLALSSLYQRDHKPNLSRVPADLSPERSSPAPTSPSHTGSLQITYDNGRQGPVVGVGVRSVGGGQQNININLSNVGGGAHGMMQSAEEPQVRGILKKPTQSVWSAPDIYEGIL